MAVEIKMPQLSDTMDAGKILTWNKKEGDTISRGDILAEVETDKANLEIESFHSGFLVKILVSEGSSANVGEVIAFVGEENESVSDQGSQNEAKPQVKQQTETSEVKTEEPASEQQSDTTQEEASASVKSDPPELVVSDSERVKASPLARKLADQNKLDLSKIAGSGPNGRIVKRDVEQVAQNKSAVESLDNRQPSPTTTSVGHTTTSQLGGKTVPLTKMRATIAKRMQQAVTEAPHFYTNISVDMSEAMKLRKVFKADPDLKDVSINHLIMKATAYALKHEPGVNCSMKGEEVFHPDQINIGIITAVEGGLMIPVIRTVDSLNLKDLAFETRAAVDRARAGRPTGSDLSGGTFSISNMGMFGVESFTAIINPGQGAILAVGATIDKPIVKNNVIQSAPIMNVTLSVDHRIIDGTMSGNWLSHFKQALEQPAILLL